MKAIYKGARNGLDYDNFTFNKEYEVKEVHDYEDSGLFIVINDLGEITEQPSIDFDF